MNFASKVIEFYQTRTYVKLIRSQILATVPVIFLVMSLTSNLKLTYKKIEDKHLRRAYHLKRVPYLIAYAVCNAILNLVLYPVILVDTQLQTNLAIDVLFIATYLFELFCLMRLEAGTAIIMHLVLCLPIMHALDKYFDAGVATVGLAADMGLFCLFHWSNNGNPLAKKYLDLHTIQDLKDKTTPKTAKPNP